MEPRRKVPKRRSQGVLIEEVPEFIPKPGDYDWINPKHKARFLRLSNLNVCTTRFPHSGTMIEFNMREDIYILFRQINLTHFLDQQWPTYEAITLEFLSSFEATNLDGKEHTVPKITFQLFNRPFELTLAEFNAIYHFPNEGHMTVPVEFSSLEFWKRITGEGRLCYKLAKASSIQNPTFRYVHRILSNTICGRGDSEGAVSKSELFFLHCMTSCTPVNVGAFLARRFQRHTHQKKGNIVIGGLITPIALHFQLNLDDIEQVPGSSFLNQKTVYAMGLAKNIPPTGNVFVFKDHQETLPCLDRDRFTPTNPANWLLFKPSDASPLPPFPPRCSKRPSHFEQPVDMAVDPPFSQAPKGLDFAAIEFTLEAIRAEQLRQAADIHRIRAEQFRQAEDFHDICARQERIEHMLRQMHDYHASQGHFKFFLPKSVSTTLV